MKISYNIGVCNEEKEFSRLLKFLIPLMDEEDEIIVGVDKDNYIPEIIEICEKYQNDNNINFHYVLTSLNKDFSSFKNTMIGNSSGDYIFNIDADEIPSEFLIKNIRLILESNPQTELFLVPRVNIVEGITKEHIKKWGWFQNENNYINFPDWQFRIFKRIPEIHWEGKVHEKIKGYNQFTYLPEDELYCLYHVKNISKQEKQNQFYLGI